MLMEDNKPVTDDFSESTPVSQPIQKPGESASVATPAKGSNPPASTIVQRHLTALNPRGLRISDAAAYAGVTVWFIRNAIWTGKLKARVAGSVHIVLREDLDAFLDSLPEVEPLHRETS